MHLRQAARLPLRLLLVAVALLSAGAQPCAPGAAAAACDSVLVIHACAPEAADVQRALEGTGAFATVDAFDATHATPTAAQLAARHAVLVFGNYSEMGGADYPNLLGDRLAAYHDQGGGVVVAVNHASWLAGAYGAAANGYVLLDYAASGGFSDTGPDSLGDVLEPQSPLLADVHSLAAASALRSTAAAIDGRAVVVARWRGGGREPLVLRGQRGSRTLVELNFWPVWGGVVLAVAVIVGVAIGAAVSPVPPLHH
jgi:hypothetical protein